MNVDGLRGFIPFSQMGPHSRTPEQQQALIGQSIKAKIIEMRGKRDLILSQRAYLEEERTRLREETLSNLAEGRWIKGHVKNLTDFGAFIDLGGIDGLLHVNDMSWSHVGHPSEVVQVGQEVDVMVLKIDGERISLGIKQAKPDPWLAVANHYPPGCKIGGKVTSLAKYGAFIELEEGVEGLVHISEISWTRRLRHPSEELKIGDEVRVKVLSIDEQRRRISLSMREATTDPWTLAKANYPIGSVIEGQITGLTDFGAFVDLDGVQALLPISEISRSRVDDINKVLSAGQEIEASIIKLDWNKQRITLSMKALLSDPWENIRKNYRIGSKYKGKVARITDFGAFVTLEPGLDGLIHISDMRTDSRDNRPDEILKKGQSVTVQINKIDTEKKRMSLKQVSSIQEDEDNKKYLEPDSESYNPFATLLNNNKG